MNIRDTLRNYIGDELLDDEVQVEDGENLLADGMVSSVGMLRIVAFIDETYGIKVPPEDFVIENFRTLECIVAYVSGKLGLQDVASRDG